MQESEEGYPINQSQDRVENGHKHPPDAKDEPALDRRQTPPPSMSPVHQREHATTPGLPNYRFRNTLIIGAIAGFFCVAQSIIITLSNASTYHAYDTAKDTAVKNALAFTIFGYAALTFFISLVILCIAGFIAGKIVVQRRLGFLAGFLAGIIFYAFSFITNIIPNYPGVQHTASSTASNGATPFFVYLLPLIFLLVWGIIGGLVSLLGAWLATRKHPYYIGY
jgi:uncharacterized membrane protein YeaQ/YmgE (transglycosylase-associated protein family)